MLKKNTAPDWAETAVNFRLTLKFSQGQMSTVDVSDFRLTLKFSQGQMSTVDEIHA